MSKDSKLSQNATNIQYTYNLPMNLTRRDADGKIVKSDVMSLMSQNARRCHRRRGRAIL